MKISPTTSLRRERLIEQLEVEWGEKLRESRKEANESRMEGVLNIG